MGQGNSSDSIPDTVEEVQDDIIRHARNITELALLTYEEFLKTIQELNNLTEKCLDPSGKQLVFAIKKGSDTTVLWKATVRIGCVKVDPVSRKIDAFSMLTLNEFLRVFRGLQCQLTALETSSEASRKLLNASMLMGQLDGFGAATAEEIHTDCCICLERKPEVMLPCAHCYCLPCIEQWNVDHKTCPICRETLTSTEDTWVISEAPGAAEINQEISSTLDNLTDARKPLA